MRDGFLGAAALLQYIGEIVVRFGGSRTQRDGTFVVNDRGVEIVELDEQIAEIVVRVRKAGIDRQRPLVAANRLLAAARCMEAATEVDVCVGQAGIGRERLRILHDSVIMPAKMPTGVAQAGLDGGRFWRDRERRLVVGQRGFELTKPLEREPKILMGFRVVLVDLKHSFVLDHCIGNIATAAEDVGQMKSGLRMSFVACDGHLELTMGACEIVYPNEGRPQHDMVFSGSPCDFDCLTNQVASLIECTKLATNRGQPAKGAEMPGLIGENPSIGLFGCLQGVSRRNGDC